MTTYPRNSDFRTRLGLRQVVNVSGTMTFLGASIICDEAIEAMAEISPEWVEMDDLQRKASATIARLTGAEAGFVTACCAAGISMSVAGAMDEGEFLQTSHAPEPQHCPLPLSESQVRVLPAVAQPASGLLAIGRAEVLQGRPVGPKPA